MPANNLPVFPNVGVVSWGSGIGANTAMDGTGGQLATLATGANNGTRCDYIQLEHLGTNVATVMRLFLNNGSTNATAANNSLFRELTVAANTVSQVAQSTQTFVMDLGGFVLPSGYKINATLGTAVAAGVQATFFGGNL